MPRLQHGAFSVDVPRGWSDQSTLLFVSPVAATAPPLARSAARAASAISIVFVGVEDVDGADAVERARAVVENEQAKLQGALPVTPGPGEAFTCEAGPGWKATQQLVVDDVSMVQTVAAVVGDRVGVLLVASCATADAVAHAGDIDAVLRSLAFAAAPQPSTQVNA